MSVDGQNGYNDFNGSNGFVDNFDLSERPEILTQKMISIVLHSEVVTYMQGIFRDDIAVIVAIMVPYFQIINWGGGQIFMISVIILMNLMVIMTVRTI